MVSLREVQPCDVHAGVDHLYELVDIVAGWTEGADNLGAAFGHVDGLEDAGELDAGAGVTDRLGGVNHLN